MRGVTMSYEDVGYTPHVIEVIQILFEANNKTRDDR